MFQKAFPILSAREWEMLDCAEGIGVRELGYAFTLNHIV